MTIEPLRRRPPDPASFLDPCRDLDPTRRPSIPNPRGFLRPYRVSLSLASGLVLVETLLDLARPWPLKVAVDNAIGGQPLGGPLGVLDGLGPAGLAAVAPATRRCPGRGRAPAPVRAADPDR